MIMDTIGWFEDTIFNGLSGLAQGFQAVIETINPILWVTSNALIIYIGLMLIVFTIGYYVLFDPRATTAGKFIFRFVLSLIGVISLTFIGIFINPSSGRFWFEYPETIDVWRPIFRVVIYGYVAYSITSLAVLLGLRKWRPDLIKTAPDRDLVVPRKLE